MIHSIYGAALILAAVYLGIKYARVFWSLVAIAAVLAVAFFIVATHQPPYQTSRGSTALEVEQAIDRALAEQQRH